MKVDELLKRLENIKIDGDEISEKREIAEYIAQIFGNDKVLWPMYSFIMKDKTLYGFNSYVDLLRSHEISEDDAYVYVISHNIGGTYSVDYLYPFFTEFILKNAYLSKLGCGPGVYAEYAPARGLKYVSITNVSTNAKRVVAEVTDLNTVVINTNLLTIVHKVLGTKGSTEYIVCKEAGKIISEVLSQKLFAGYNFNEAREIIRKYYKDNDTSLAKEAEAIKDAYNQIFKPYRVVYDIKTKRFILTYPRPPIGSFLNAPSSVSHPPGENVKIGELFKRLETNEKREIAENLAQLSANNSLHTHYYIMTKDKKIYDILSYRELLKSNKISPNDAYVYVLIDNVYHLASYYLPFLVDNFLLFYAYLSRLGYEYHNNVVPATGLKYVAAAVRYENNYRMAVEVIDLDNVVTDMNLPTLTHGVLSTEYIDDYKVEEIVSQLESQILVTEYEPRVTWEYSFNSAWSLASWHCDHGDKTKSILKSVEVIRDAYVRFFKPYRVVYDLYTKQLISSNK